MVSEMNNKLKHIKEATKRRLGIDQPPGPASRVGGIVYEQKYSTAAPTKTHRDSYAIAKEEFAPIKEKITKLYKEDMAQLEKLLDQMGHRIHRDAY